MVNSLREVESEFDGGGKLFGHRCGTGDEFSERNLKERVWWFIKGLRSGIKKERYGRRIRRRVKRERTKKLKKKEEESKSNPISSVCLCTSGELKGKLSFTNTLQINTVIPIKGLLWNRISSSSFLLKFLVADLV